MYVVKCWINPLRVFYFTGNKPDDIVTDQRSARRFTSKSEAKRVFHQHMDRMGVSSYSGDWKFRLVHLKYTPKVGDHVISDRCAGGREVVYRVQELDQDGQIAKVVVVKSPSGGLGFVYAAQFTCQFSRVRRAYVCIWEYMGNHGNHAQRDFFSNVDRQRNLVYRQEATVFTTRREAAAALKVANCQDCFRIIPA